MSSQLRDSGGFSKRLSFDLDADAIILVAANGHGKTSFFDALLWGLSGRLPRLQRDDVPNDAKLISLYSETGGMQVSVSLRDETGRVCRVSRSSTGANQLLSVDIDGTQYQGGDASNRLLQILWPAALTTDDPNGSLAAAVTHSVYLQQDLVRNFIEAQNEQTRFNAVSDLVGTGRLTDLQVRLDNERSAWTRASNVRLEELRLLRQRLSTLENQLSQLSESAAGPELSEEYWRSWWANVQALGVRVLQVPGRETAEAAVGIDSAIKQLGAIKAATERTQMTVESLLKEINSRVSRQLPKTDILRAAYDSANQLLESARRGLQDAQLQAAEERRKQVVHRNEQDELRTLATLALRHLGEYCPVCGQRYDRSKTISDLRAKTEPGSGQPEEARSEHIVKLAEIVSGRERELAAAQDALRQAETMERDHQLWLNELRMRLLQLGIDSATQAPETALPARLNELKATFTSLANQQAIGERMALMLARSAERSRRSEFENELGLVRRQVEKLDRIVSNRQQTAERATRILEGLREAATDVVEVELNRMGSVLQKIYAGIDPHPAFRIVQFLARFAYRRGRLLLSIHDSSAQISSESPETILSSSQLNALAVAVFLTFNLGLQRLPLTTALLDDPLQILDDINLLGIVDLLRRAKAGRQLIVSTHDPRLGQLLEKKLRSVTRGQRTRILEFESWTREGPLVIQRDVEPDARPLKIAV